jgi:hypothetical protein
MKALCSNLIKFEKGLIPAFITINLCVHMNVNFEIRVSSGLPMILLKESMNTAQQKYSIITSNNIESYIYTLDCTVMLEYDSYKKYQCEKTLLLYLKSS